MADGLGTYDEDSWDMSARRERAVMAEGVDLFDADEPQFKLPSDRGRLSAEEIEMLLRPDLSDMDAAPVEPETVTPRAVETFDTPQPQQQAVPASHADMEDAQRLAARLSLALRRDCGLQAAATAKHVTNATFGSALETAGRGSAVACYAGPTGEIAAMFVLSAALCDRLIETACGGAAIDNAPQIRALTPLDAALLEGLVRPLGAAIGADLSFARVEIDTGFAAALAPPGDALAIDLSVRVTGGEMPACLVLSRDDLFESAPALEQPAAMGAVSPAEDVTAIVTARVASLSVPLSRLTDLKAGSTLLLGIPADQPVELLSGGRDGRAIAEGSIGRKGGKMAIRIDRAKR